VPCTNAHVIAQKSLEHFVQYPDQIDLPVLGTAYDLRGMDYKSIEPINKDTDRDERVEIEALASTDLRTKGDGVIFDKVAEFLRCARNQYDADVPRARSVVDCPDDARALSEMIRGCYIQVVGSQLDILANYDKWLVEQHRKYCDTYDYGLGILSGGFTVPQRCRLRCQFYGSSKAIQV
jgi:hypothetical protein